MTSLLTTAIFLISYLGMQKPLKTFIDFGLPSLFLLGKIVPSSPVYFLFHDGGPPAALGLAIIGAYGQLAVLSSIGVYFLKYKKILTTKCSRPGFQ